MSKHEQCPRCKRIKRKCICRRERNLGVVKMRNRVAAGSMGNQGKEDSRNQCRDRVRGDND